MAQILDSGERRQFESGAVRDIVEGKGRCDLLPLREVADIFYNSGDDNIADILSSIHEFCMTGHVSELIDAIEIFTIGAYHESIQTCILDVAIHYEQGCDKYGERNWEKGIPLHCYIDSGIRHLLKYFRGDKDEPHDRAFVWNMLGAAWTARNKPELLDLPFAVEVVDK